MDPAKLKVVELRAELSKRGLDTKGNKPVLVERLREALEEEKTNPKAHSHASHKSEKGSDSEEERINTRTRTPEPSKLPPRTPSRSSRHTSREPTTPVRTPSRRSSSRSSLSRQSPVKTLLAESLSEPALDPITEEDKSSPKKDAIAPTPKKELIAATSKKEAVPATPKRESVPAATPKKEAAPAPTPKKEAAPELTPKKEAAPESTPKKEAAPAPTPTKEAAPVPTPKKDVATTPTPKKEAAPVPIPKKEAAPVPTPKKEAAPAPAPNKDVQATPAPKVGAIPGTPKKEAGLATPKKENIVHNETPKQKKDDKLEILKEAEKHVSAKPQEITRRDSEEVKKENAEKINAQSPVKPVTQSPAKPVSQSPAKLVIESPTKLPQQSPAKLVAESPEKPVSQSSIKPVAESSVTPTTESPAKPVTQPVSQSPIKPTIESPFKSASASPSKAQSPVKADTQSPAKADIQSPAEANIESPVKADTKSPVKTTSQSPVKLSTQSPVKPLTQSPVKHTTPQKVEQSPVKEDIVESPNKKFKSDETETIQTERNIEESESEEKDETTRESMEVDQEDDTKTMDTDEQDDKDEKMDEKSDERKRKRSPSPRQETPRAPPIARPENEPNYDENAVLLSWYDSDLHLVINPTNYFSASPMQRDGFNYMWAGARVSHGFNKGKVYYEARVHSEFDNIAASAGTSNTSGAIPADDEKIPSVMRLGWSTIGTSLQLGEEKLSYGYEGTGKKSSNNVFTEYGKTFAKDDVVGCYADFETDENVTLTFTVNGETQGPAFIIQKEELEGKALFPHVLGKNCSFSLNLGQEEHWSKDILDGYENVGKIDLNDRIAGPRRPDKREDCEVILLCGLPFSGKTTWAIKHVAEHPEKLYCILGTYSLIEKMKVEGAPLKDTYKGRWETVVEKCSRALLKLLESAPSRRRNYILDQQANVYGSAQKRKMRNFYGFHRKAIVLVPSDDEFKARIAKRKGEADGEEIREASILEVKANLSAPSVGESFEEVEWAELGEEEGKKLIETYNTEGKTAGYGQTQQQLNKRSRFDDGHKDRNSRDSRDHRRSGYNDRRSSSGSWRGGPSGGGWREGNRIRGSPMRHGPGYAAQGAWRGRGGSPMPQPRTPGGDRRPANDRRQGNDRNRPRGGGWNAIGYQGNQHGNTNVWGNQGNWQSQSQASWTGQQASGGAWNQQQQVWSGTTSGWKGYGQNNYGQSATGYGQAGSGYGNGNWNNWNQQYYSQYWTGGSGGQQQQQQTSQTGGQTQAATGAGGAGGGGQAAGTTTAYNDGYDYSSDWQDYSQSYDYTTQPTDAAEHQQQ